MSHQARYMLVSLPTSISPTNDRDEAFTALQSTVSSDFGTVSPFSIPEFKIGTLDALVQQADELAKLDAACEGVIGKVGDSLRSILGGDESKLNQQKRVAEKPVDQYLRSFIWNKVKYRADKPIAELIDALQKEISSIDNDVRSKYNQYNQVKTNLVALQRKQTGNLSTRSLAQLVDPSVMIQGSEYLETHLVAVPSQAVKDFYKSYETVSSMVVPRSCISITSDDEYTLFAVTTFKKYSQEFIHNCRERRWTPRDYTYREGGREEELREVDRLSREERKLWGETLRLGHTGWSEAVMVWAHVLVLRVFVETVLRYGLPLSFVCGLIKTSPKFAKKTKDALDASYSYLGGNAFGRDKKGRVKRDDSAVSEMAAVGHGDGGEYNAFVFYEFEIN
ncbi:vacuolar ATP synthase-like protein subunit C 1 [Xylona heveae TC161]|uniref:V-type proton ATPase subunit C n=1 Tax=Xylona heveae (strain CBS 132557 / TC161) TaxID=1328760 RepID=A0A165JJI7_XYLHT|nr:vacuolar ATP synthase-like protein subunit C 1 [Xylona heveae TC161]KZF26315.1 vacuolar ATP synthase-like protein subunit C 1 [Xylona heveae TC161]